ncbi:hypothetical protein Tco_1171898, partial [Tanacetum coccineum]
AVGTLRYSLCPFSGSIPFFNKEPDEGVDHWYNQEILSQSQESVVNYNQPGWRLTVEEHVDEAHTTPNAKGKEVDTSATPEPPKMNKQCRKRKQPDASDYVPIMIYYNNRGRSERIFNQKMKKSGLVPNGEGLAQNSAFSI